MRNYYIIWRYAYLFPFDAVALILEACGFFFNGLNIFKYA